MVIYYQRFRTTYRFHPQGLFVFDYWTLRMGRIGYSETSVRNYHYSLRNTEEHSYHNFLLLLWLIRMSFYLHSIGWSHTYMYTNSVLLFAEQTTNFDDSTLVFTAISNKQPLLQTFEERINQHYAYLKTHYIVPRSQHSPSRL